VDEKIKRKWLKALRSGEYEKGVGQLVIEGEEYDRFCCLGVLCDVLNLEMGDQAWGNADEYVKGDYYGNDGDLPEEVATRVGLTHTQQCILAALNDEGEVRVALDPDGNTIAVNALDSEYSEIQTYRAKSFKGIAAFIEKHI